MNELDLVLLIDLCDPFADRRLTFDDQCLRWCYLKYRHHVASLVLVRHRILPSKQNELEMEPTHYTKLTFSLCDFNQWKVPLELKLRRCVGEQALSSLIRRERGAKSSVPDDGDQLRSLRAICLVAHQRTDWTVPERTISGAKRIAAPLA